MEYCCHVWACAPSCYLQMLEKLQKWICRTVGPSLAVSLELFGHFLNVASFSLFYKAIATYFFVGQAVRRIMLGWLVDKLIIMILRCRVWQFLKLKILIIKLLLLLCQHKLHPHLFTYDSKMSILSSRVSPPLKT